MFRRKAGSKAVTGARTYRPAHRRGYTAATVRLRDLVVTIHDSPSKVTVAVYPYEPHPGDAPLDVMVVKRGRKTILPASAKR